MKNDIKSLVVGALLGAAVAFSIGAARYSPKWDYKFVAGYEGELARDLKQAAADGWEVVAATSENGHPLLVLRKPK